MRELVDRLEFDTIYHEHLCYFSVTALDALFDRQVFLNRVRPIPIHGGSLRLTVGVAGSRRAPFRLTCKRRLPRDWTGFEHYRGFGDRVEGLPGEPREMLERLRRSGKRIAAYGAAAKGTMLLNSSGIGTDLVAFVADKSPHKQGKLMPGVRIPIVGPSGSSTRCPTTSCSSPGTSRMRSSGSSAPTSRRRGTFIVPIPDPVEIGREALEPAETH